MMFLLSLLTLIAPTSVGSTSIGSEAKLGPYAVLLRAPADDVPEMEYTYVEANYLWTHSDDADENVDGWELTGSLELPLNFFGQVTFSRQSSDADLDTYRIGAGYHLPLGSRFDAFGILSVAHKEIDGSGNDFDDTGMAAEVGGRMLLSPKLELNGSVEWADVDDSEYGLGVGARFYLIDALSFGGRIESVDSDESFSAGLRLDL